VSSHSRVSSRHGVQVHEQTVKARVIQWGIYSRERAHRKGVDIAKKTLAEANLFNPYNHNLNTVPSAQAAPEAPQDTILGSGYPLDTTHPLQDEDLQDTTLGFGHPIDTSYPPQDYLQGSRDPDVFAWLLPANEDAAICFRVSSNPMEESCGEAAIGSQDLTPAPELPASPALALRFNDTDTQRWTIGRSKSLCTLVLQAHGISRRHCCITVEHDGVYIIDTSSHGTKVSFDGGEPQEGKSSKWLIYQPGQPPLWNTLQLQLGTVAMWIVLPALDPYVVTYLNNVKMFMQASRAALPPMTPLNIASATSSGTPTWAHPTDSYVHPASVERDIFH
jgi:hypothetical protein